jgi:hypothetical protein
VTYIDAPRLHYLEIIFFNQIDFDTPRLAQFINRTPTSSTRDDAHVRFDDGAVDVRLTYRTHEPDYETSRIAISCREPDWQLSSIAQVCNSCWPPLSIVEDLYIEHQYSRRVWKNDAIENTLWLEPLLPFTVMKNLYLHKDFAPGIAAALQELVGARITEIFPGLQNIFVQGWGFVPQRPFREHIEQFMAARQLSGHPVTISVGIKQAGKPYFVPTYCGDRQELDRVAPWSLRIPSPGT